jgi:hypothetical protein
VPFASWKKRKRRHLVHAPVNVFPSCSGWLLNSKHCVVQHGSEALAGVGRRLSGHNERSRGCGQPWRVWDRRHSNQYSGGGAQKAMFRTPSLWSFGASR